MRKLRHYNLTLWFQSDISLESRAGGLKSFLSTGGSTKVLVSSLSLKELSVGFLRLQFFLFCLSHQTKSWIVQRNTFVPDRLFSLKTHKPTESPEKC